MKDFDNEPYFLIFLLLKRLMYSFLMVVVSSSSSCFGRTVIDFAKSAFKASGSETRLFLNRALLSQARTFLDLNPSFSEDKKCLGLWGFEPQLAGYFIFRISRFSSSQIKAQKPIKYLEPAALPSYATTPWQSDHIKDKYNHFYILVS